jgi:transposase-like protein
MKLPRRLEQKRRRIEKRRDRTWEHRQDKGFIASIAMENFVPTCPKCKKAMVWKREINWKHGRFICDECDETKNPLAMGEDFG